MKEAKISIVATIITIIMLLATAFAMPAGAEEADRGEFYPKLAVVVDSSKLDSKLWIVTCLDREGHEWTFYDDEGDWEIGDIANLTMWNMGENEEDDELIEVYWEGYTENIELFFQIMGWR